MKRTRWGVVLLALLVTGSLYWALSPRQRAQESAEQREARARDAELLRARVTEQAEQDSARAQARTVQRLYDQVVADSRDRYDIAKKSGTAMDACVQAGFVSAALLQAKKAQEYAEWKSIQKADCVRAGVPQ